MLVGHQTTILSPWQIHLGQNTLLRKKKGRKKTTGRINTTYLELIYSFTILNKRAIKSHLMQIFTSFKRHGAAQYNNIKTRE